LSPRVVPPRRGKAEPPWSWDGGPLSVVAMKAAPESFLLEERLRLLKQSATNSWVPKRMVSLREKPPHVKHSPSMETASTDE
jgi:hypothetical protein